MPTESTRILIVGGGVAGLLLARRLAHRNPIVLGGTSFPAASRVAAGILNPVTGRRFSLLPGFAAYRDAARETYRAIPGGDRCFRETTLRRFFLDPAEIERFESRRRDPGFEPFLGPREKPGSGGLPVADPHGSFRIHGVAQVDLPPLLDRIRADLGGLYRDVDADWSTLEADDDGFRLNGIRTRHLVSCDGAGVRTNPLFRWLPFRPVRGETLTVRLSGIADLPEILHHSKWIAPLGAHRFRIGSTYQRPPGTGKRAEAPGVPVPAAPTTEGKAELLDACRRIFPGETDPEILDHRAGVRPCTRDNAPYLGRHPLHPLAWICNGLGSKGALYAPLLARRLADAIENDVPPDPALDPGRVVRKGFPARIG